MRHVPRGPGEATAPYPPTSFRNPGYWALCCFSMCFQDHLCSEGESWGTTHRRTLQAGSDPQFCSQQADESDGPSNCKWAEPCSHMCFRGEAAWLFVTLVVSTTALRVSNLKPRLWKILNAWLQCLKDNCRTNSLCSIVTEFTPSPSDFAVSQVRISGHLKAPPPQATSPIDPCM